ncbi:MAG: alpha/beta hydrolase [Leptolyngbyaceae cyanobacterium]
MAAPGSRLQMLTRRLMQCCSRAITLVGLGLLATASPTLSAEEIIFTYGFFERTIAIEDLAAFANGQGLTPQLRQYAEILQLSETDLEAAQQLLTDPADLGEVAMSQFLYTTQGELLLNTLSEVLQTPARQRSFLAIRSALILAAADDENGLTLLNFLKKFPTPGIRIDVSQALGIASTISETVDRAERAIALVEASAAIEAVKATNAPLPSSILVDATAPYTVIRQPINLTFRRIEATLFLPQATASSPLPDTIPVIVISHGLGDERASYDYLAEYLAGRGFAVATLDHPGSNSEQIASLLAGLSPDLVDTQEFLNRPGDVSALLNEIEQFALQSATFSQRLDTRNVGVVGQSFGGYTALTLAGASFNPEVLDAACGPQTIYLNPSLLLQCQARDVTTVETPSLADARVKAILVVNPIGSQIFGPSGYAQIEHPIMVLAAAADTVAPGLPEQIEPFTWLQTPYRYLVLINDTTHFSVIANRPRIAPSIDIPNELLGANPPMAQEYLEKLSLAFFRRHLEADIRYEAVLTSRYVEAHIERPTLEPLSLIRELTPEALDEAITAQN